VAPALARSPSLGGRLNSAARYGREYGGRPVFSSDFTYFDVPDFADVIPEAFEMVEKGFVTEQDFRELAFTNAAMLHTRNSPAIFKGTLSGKRLPMSWAWKEHRRLRARRQTIIIMTS
jgi:hypothetical protein